MGGEEWQTGLFQIGGNYGGLATKLVRDPGLDPPLIKDIIGMISILWSRWKHWVNVNVLFYWLYRSYVGENPHFKEIYTEILRSNGTSCPQLVLT